MKCWSRHLRPAQEEAPCAQSSFRLDKAAALTDGHWRKQSCYRCEPAASALAQGRVALSLTHACQAFRATAAPIWGDVVELSERCGVGIQVMILLLRPLLSTGASRVGAAAMREDDELLSREMWSLPQLLDLS